MYCDSTAVTEQLCTLSHYKYHCKVDGLF